MPFSRTSQPRTGRCTPNIGVTCGIQAVPEVSLVGVSSGAVTPTCSCTSILGGSSCWAEAAAGPVTIAAITINAAYGRRSVMESFISTNDDSSAEQHRLRVRHVVIAGFRGGKWRGGTNLTGLQQPYSSNLRTTGLKRT